MAPVPVVAAVTFRWRRPLPLTTASLQSKTGSRPGGRGRAGRRSPARRRGGSLFPPLPSPCDGAPGGNRGTPPQRSGRREQGQMQEPVPPRRHGEHHHVDVRDLRRPPLARLIQVHPILLQSLLPWPSPCPSPGRVTRATNTWHVYITTDARKCT